MEGVEGVEGVEGRNEIHWGEKRGMEKKGREMNFYPPYPPPTTHS